MRQLLPFILLAGCQGQITPQAPPPPEVSYAWVTFDASRIRGGGASGVADRSSARNVTVDDPVRIASISKLFVAIGVMRLVEQKRLNLDEDVSRYLGWTLRNPAFPEAPVTLRMLLSHTSSVKDEGDDYVIPLGRALQPMASDAKSFDAEHSPGSYFRYSNLNYPIIGSVLEKVTGERFDRLMSELVMKPLGLDACFNWTTCSDAKIARAVVLYRPDGSVARDDLKGEQPDCPVFTVDPGCNLSAYVLGANGALFSPQGGVRASMADLAVVGQLLLNRGRHKGAQFLSRASMETIVGPVWRFDGSNGATDDGFYCAYGLATQSLPTSVEGCSDDLFGNGRQVVGHAGDAYGLKSGLWIDRKRGVGIAYFSANNPAEPQKGRSAYRAVEEFLASKLN